MDLFGEEEELSSDKNITFDSIENEKEIEKFGHPRTMQFCLGHKNIETKLLEYFNTGHLPHGFIFSGLNGIGKATMAYRFAKFLLEKHESEINGNKSATLNTMHDEQSARLVTSGAHPDLMSIERLYDTTKNRYKAGIEVSEIRKVAPFLHMTAANNGWRIVIIDDADTMNRNSQNALLKILEEPPKNTVIILITHRLGALIPTIRSRTQLIHFHPLPHDILKELLILKGLDLNTEEFNTLAHMSSGSFGKTLQYIEDGGLDTLGKIIDIFQSYPNWNWPDIHIMADAFARVRQDQEFQNFQDLLQWIFTELVLTKARNQEIQNSALNIKIFQKLLKNSSLEQLVKICENLQGHFNKVNVSNLDKRQAVLGAFLLITE
ncbi:MAG: DNA polymerase III subunit delta' [Alphaproteobacteria bacterium]|nr:DNA polymerase III subunit delta' [Alphaproteobacteria bacterium]